MLNKLVYKREERVKNAFYCSDINKMDIDLYFSWIGEPITNPHEWTKSLRWGAGIGMEEAMLEILKQNKITKEDYDQEEHGYVDMEREGIEIHGRIDAMTNGEKSKEFDLKPNCPIEIKSINNKNSVDIKKYENGYPRENYVGQLATYMDFLEVDTGYLFVASIDGLNTFMFECKRNGDVYTCGATSINLKEEYKRWAKIFVENIKNKIIPEIPCRYKIPVDEIDWKTVSKGDISKARNGRKVIGDPESWQIQYSPWKYKILELQGVSPGYSEEEITKINEATKGYTTWGK